MAFCFFKQWTKRGGEVIFQKRVRVFRRGFQTRENCWKHEAVGRRVFANPDETRSTSLTKNNEKILTVFGIVEYKLLFWVLFFSNYWPLLSNVSSVTSPWRPSLFKAEDIYIFWSQFGHSNEIWRCHVFGKPKQRKKRLIWFERRYPSPLNTKVNGLMECSKSGKGSEMKSGQVSGIFAPKCSSTSNVSSSREVQNWQNYRRSWCLAQQILVNSCSLNCRIK